MNDDITNSTQDITADTPASFTPQDITLDETLNKNYPVNGDLDIQPDPTLNSYQEDINTGVVNQETDLQNPQDDTPASSTQMPIDVLKNELDGMAFGEAANTNEAPNDDMPNGDDMREHVEDMDENDK